ncbi:MlaD family protein [Flavihumibacter profundi]|uniref:MlaD family protein n=1 Tax=Flavihumibacter profundi TaxID=2716883 RepID=UPI001CC592F8|nr:MlaD family protein [Flavihumibacter profundi]MBZ5855594.1 MlaD family protein [Flavihumibacter profundi]
MAKRLMDNAKLGIFVVSGLLFLVLLLYMIGKNRNLFGSTYELKVKFENVQGLMTGNNVRVSGIEAGTVKKINILNDTTIEVTLLIEKRMQTIIRRNAIVSIGTEGLVGNKVVNIVPSREPANLAVEGDFLSSQKNVDTYEMIQTLSKTNNDVAEIATGLKTTIQKINSSSGLWALLNDSTIPKNLRISVANIKVATGKAAGMANSLNELVSDVKSGKGSLGEILKDTGIAYNLNEAILKINKVGSEADSLAREVSELIDGVKQDINSGKGTVNLILRDSVAAAKLSVSLDNIQKGTDGFNQNMEALKHSFLLSGYFRKQEKKKQKAEKADSLPK